MEKVNEIVDDGDATKTAFRAVFCLLPAFSQNFTQSRQGRDVQLLSSLAVVDLCFCSREAGEHILIGSDSELVVVTHKVALILEHPLLYGLFYSIWGLNLRNEHHVVLKKTINQHLRQ